MLAVGGAGFTVGWAGIPVTWAGLAVGWAPVVGLDVGLTAHLFVSAGQSADEPVQSSAGSHGAVEARQTVVFDFQFEPNGMGQVTLAWKPGQNHPLSQTPAGALHCAVFPFGHVMVSAAPRYSRAISIRNHSARRCIVGCEFNAVTLRSLL